MKQIRETELLAGQVKKDAAAKGAEIRKDAHEEAAEILAAARQKARDAAEGKLEAARKAGEEARKEAAARVDREIRDLRESAKKKENDAVDELLKVLTES